MRRGELHREQILFRRGAADAERDVVGRARGRAERLHFFDEERHERLRVQQRLRLLIKVSLVRASAALRDAEELVFHAFRRLEVDLRGQVALRVHFVVHRERRVLRVAQIFLGVGLIDAERERFLVAEAGPDLLPLFAVNDRRSRVLTERELALAGDFRVAQERERDVLVVLARVGIAEDLRDLLVVRTAQHERDVAERRVRHRGEAFLGDLEDGNAFELAHGDVIFREQIIFGLVFAERERVLIFEGRDICHKWERV